MPHTILIPEATRDRAADYLLSLISGGSQAGRYLAAGLAKYDLSRLSDAEFLDVLINTKIPQIFAESAVAGDGSDWNLTELAILGDISISIQVNIFDNGSHQSPLPHASPLPGTLVFTPGALLRNGRGHPPADWAEVTRSDESISPEGYFTLYERRLLPVFQHINATSANAGKSAFITIPGLGCGCFAGPFSGQLGTGLQKVLEQFLEIHGTSFPCIKGVYFDPFNECTNARFEIHGISLMIRPLLQGNSLKSQLCPPQAYAEQGDDFTDCTLFSIVAWDHVSWPGNDFFAGSRCTDDGVKAAATDSMCALTGIAGHYDPKRGAYQPPPPYRTWAEVVVKNSLRL